MLGPLLNKVLSLSGRVLLYKKPIRPMMDYAPEGEGGSAACIHVRRLQVLQSVFALLLVPPST